MSGSPWNPRILLPSVLGVVLFFSIAGAYLDRPRIAVGCGGIGGTVPIVQRDFRQATVRSAGFRRTLQERLQSAELMPIRQ
jgi:hypothetical protein